MTRSIVARSAASLVVLVCLAASACAQNERAAEITEASVASSSFNTAIASAGAVDVRLGWIPDGYQQTDNQNDFIVLIGWIPSGEQYDGRRDSVISLNNPLVWTRCRDDGRSKEKSGQPSFIFVLIAPSVDGYPLVSPRWVLGGATVLRDVRGTSEVWVRTASEGLRDYPLE